MDIKEKIGTLRNVQKEEIFLGVGSDEAIDIIIRIFCNPREDNILITPPTYGMYKVCAKVNDVAVKAAPLTPAFDVDLASIQSNIDGKTKVIFLCSPGNPTSKIIPNAHVEAVLEKYSTGGVMKHCSLSLDGLHSFHPTLGRHCGR